MNQAVYDHQVRGHVQKLIAFLGPSNLEKCIDKYRDSLSYSGPIFREHYLKTRHPWWEALSTFYEIEKSGKSVQNHLTPELKRLTLDAMMISDLQRNMPINVKNKFKKDLLDNENAVAFLFELQIGWHFHQRGHELSWYEGKRQPEFCVKTQGIAFDVECKRISYDAFRKIRRRDFYRFAEILLPQLSALKLQGKLDVELYDRFHGSNQYIEKLSNGILTTIKTHGTEGVFDFSLGTVSLNLREKTNILINIDIEAELRELNDQNGQDAHTVIFAKRANGHVVDPVTVTMKSRKKNAILDGIKDKIQGAATRQLKSGKAGLIVCFLETITASDLHELAGESALKNMSAYILNKKENAHIAALIFCAEREITRQGPAENSIAKALTFQNPNCVFEQIRDFPFFEAN